VKFLEEKTIKSIVKKRKKKKNKLKEDGVVKPIPIESKSNRDSREKYNPKS